jgi:hypothetical protein
MLREGSGTIEVESASAVERPARKRSKRGAGEGSVYRRKSDGRWVGAAIVGYTAGGRPRRRVVYGATQREALDELRRFQADAKAGRIVEPHKLTVDAYLTTVVSLRSPRSKA